MLMAAFLLNTFYSNFSNLYWIILMTDSLICSALGNTRSPSVLRILEICSLLVSLIYLLSLTMVSIRYLRFCSAFCILFFIFYYCQINPDTVSHIPGSGYWLKLAFVTTIKRLLFSTIISLLNIYDTLWKILERSPPLLATSESSVITIASLTFEPALNNSLKAYELTISVSTPEVSSNPAVST